MVTKNIETPKIVVERQGKVGENPNIIFVDVSDQSFQRIPRKDPDLDTRILDDIGPVIELERNVEGIGISHQSYSNNQSNRDKMTEGKRKPSLKFFRKSLLVPIWPFSLFRF
jgi:hypothetical protein